MRRRHSLQHAVDLIRVGSAVIKLLCLRSIMPARREQIILLSLWILKLLIVCSYFIIHVVLNGEANLLLRYHLSLGVVIRLASVVVHVSSRVRSILLPGWLSLHT